MKYEQMMREMRRNGFEVSFYETAEQAADDLVSKVRGVTVGFGDSATLFSMGLSKRLAEHNVVINPEDFSGDGFIEIGKQALTAEVFFTSVNAAAETGEMVNIDSTGNRVAGSLFGHQKVFFVLGVNKIEPTLEKAIWRARNIAAPQNAKRFGFQTPCAVRGDRCYNCNSPDRICNALCIYLHKMKNTEAEVVIIDEPLGL